MRQWLLGSLFLLSSGQAVRLLGTTSSFSRSPVCQEFQCGVPVISQTREGWTRYRYPLKQQPAAAFLVDRSHGIIQRVAWQVGVSDYLFGSLNDPNLLAFQRFTQTVTGYAPTPGTLFQVERKCMDSAAGVAHARLPSHPAAQLDCALVTGNDGLILTFSFTRR